MQIYFQLLKMFLLEAQFLISLFRCHKSKPLGKKKKKPKKERKKKGKKDIVEEH